MEAHLAFHCGAFSRSGSNHVLHAVALRLKALLDVIRLHIHEPLGAMGSVVHQWVIRGLGAHASHLQDRILLLQLLQKHEKVARLQVLRRATAVKRLSRKPSS